MQIPKEIKSILHSSVHFSTSEKMDAVDNDTIQAVVTSPPYWDVKNYDHPDQIGYGESYEKYLERLDLVWSECYRVLKKSGTLWIVIDKIWREGDVLPIPYDIINHCKKIGFYCKEVIIWNKSTAIAGLNPRNMVNKFEYILMFSKSPSNCYLNLDLKEKNTSGPDYSYRSQRITDLWRIPVKAGNIRKTPDHKAPFPEELIHRIISLSSSERDIVLDPFLGSGTTMLVALNLKRRFIGYELNPEFESIMASRLKDLKLSAFDN